MKRALGIITAAGLAVALSTVAASAGFNKGGYRGSAKTFALSAAASSGNVGIIGLATPWGSYTHVDNTSEHYTNSSVTPNSAATQSGSFNTINVKTFGSYSLIGVKSSSSASGVSGASYSSGGHSPRPR